MVQYSTGVLTPNPPPNFGPMLGFRHSSFSVLSMPQLCIREPLPPCYRARSCSLASMQLTASFAFKGGFKAGCAPAGLGTTPLARPIWAETPRNAFLKLKVS